MLFSKIPSPQALLVAVRHDAGIIRAVPNTACEASSELLNGAFCQFVELLHSTRRNFETVNAFFELQEDLLGPG